MKVKLKNDHKRSRVKLSSGGYVSKTGFVSVSKDDLVVRSLLDADLVEVKEDSDGSNSSDTESDVCEVVKGDGEVCGRSRPCPYHD